MQPIELNGKTFCSNCGLTVGSVTSRGPIAQISQTNTRISPINDISAPKEPPASPSTPIKDGAKEELGLPKNGPDDLIFSETTPTVDAENEQTMVSDEPSVVSEPRKVAVNTVSEDLKPESFDIPTSEETTETIASLDNSDDNTVISDLTEIEEAVKNAQVDTLEEQETVTDLDLPETPIETDIITPSSEVSQDILEVIPPMGQSIEIPSESDFESLNTDDGTDPAEEVNSKSITEKIEEVDTLGASGILLDILNENYKSDARETDLQALEAAKKLVKNIKISENTDQAPEVKVPNYGILTNKPENPLEFPEIKDPLEELELTAPDIDAKVAIPETETDIETNLPVEQTEAIVESSSTDTPHKDLLYTLPHELTPMPDPQTPEETTDDIQKVENALVELENTTVDDAVKDSIMYDPDTVSDLRLPDKGTDDVKPLPASNAGDNPKSSPSPHAAKQEIVTAFFKQKIEGPKAKDGLFGKSKNEKSVPKKVPTEVQSTAPTTVPVVANKGPKVWPIIAITLPVLLFTVLAAFFIYFYLYKPVEPPVVQVTTTQTTDFASLTPSEIPLGFEVVSTNFDEAEKKLTIRYEFSADKDKVLIYTQRELDTDFDLSESVKAFVDSKNGAAYTAKTENDTAYTEFDDGTLVWTKDKFIFTIEAVNYDYGHDQIYKMAQSLG